MSLLVFAVIFTGVVFQPEFSSGPAEGGSDHSIGANQMLESNSAAAVDWNFDPDALVLVATSCCGKIQRVALDNYIPDLLIWGTGRIVRTQPVDSAGRRVLESKLSAEQLHGILESVSRDGFFDWNQNYPDKTLADAPQRCLTITFENREQTVCAHRYYGPDAFHRTYHRVTDIPYSSQENYVPEAGYLIAHPVDIPKHLESKPDMEWPSDLSGFTLDEATGGIWIEGLLLEQAWRVVNANWRGPLVVDGDNYYQISVQVRGLSNQDLPLR